MKKIIKSRYVKKETDESLMILVRNGDLDSVAPLFERYHVKLYNFFLRLTFDKELSQDLTQNVFYRIIKYKHTYNAEYKFRTWMYQMARNILADHYEKNKIITSDYYKPEKLSDNFLSDQEEVEKQERHKALYEALAKLAPEQREIIVLSRFQGLKYQEISKINGITVGAIKVKVHRAINKLKEAYFENV